MGCWEVYCPLCGNPPRQYEGKPAPWLFSCYFLTNDNRVIRGCQEVMCNIQFKDKKGNQYLSTLDEKNAWKMEELDVILGAFVHRDCYIFIQKTYGMNLKLGDFFIKNPNINPIKPFNSNYVNFGGIGKYWKQFLDVNKMIEDKNEWMLESPLKNQKNAKRIKKIFQQLKIRKDRQGPSQSASFYPNHTYKIGNDGYFWVVQNKKWVKVNERPIQETIPWKDSIRKKIPMIYSTSKKPSFITSYNKKKDYIKIIHL
jgi:hypothetical protein